MHANPFLGGARGLAAPRHRAAEPSTTAFHAGKSPLARAGRRDAPRSFRQTRCRSGGVGDLAARIRFDRCAGRGDERVTLIDGKTKVGAARDHAVVGELDLKWAQAMLTARVATRPIAPAAELSTAAGGADGSRDAIRPLAACVAVRRSPRPFAGRRDPVSHRKRHTRNGSRVERATHACLIVADAGRAAAHPIGRGRDLPPAVEDRLAGRRCRPVFDGVRRTVIAGSAARHTADESPRPKGK